MANFERRICLLLQLVNIHPWLFKEMCFSERNYYVFLHHFYKICIPWEDAPLRKVLSGHMVVCALYVRLRMVVSLKTFTICFPMQEHKTHNRITSYTSPGKTIIPY